METQTYAELVKQMKKVPVFESRIDQNDLKEFVVKEENITPLHMIFQKYFQEFKSPSEIPTLEDKRRTARWGGIREHQALYFKEEKGFSHCAMIWPWEDGTRCTVKVVRWQ